MQIHHVLFGALLSFSALLHANDITSGWKTIDDQTGYSRGDVTVVKNADGTYSGTLTAICRLPYKPLVEVCLKCKAKLSANGKRLTMRGYIGVSALGRSTTWIRND